MHLNCVDGTTLPLAAFHLQGNSSGLGRAQSACKNCRRDNKKVSNPYCPWEMNPITDRTGFVPSVTISARVGAVSCAETSASMLLGGPNMSRFAVSAAERPTGDARMFGLVITAPLAEKRASIYPGKAEAAACG